ncbi:hypothetical protein LCER1_G008780 [Lachnellula cervina]|uniref:BTB domain-containing protein n=1 Tax=Lachnellula cervina TaxID=1316786 RepID=A0A7D8YLN9_9HELO|nr:hypothetical protein LCER1_G008780 [Lachnellula cervina]
MPTTPPSKESLHEVLPDSFASSVLQLYTGTQVTIRIKGENWAKEYKVPKGLLCKQSPYFAAMFEGKFREGEEQSATLEELEGVVSVRSFETLLQYLFLGKIVHPGEAKREEIGHVIEFMRFADMCGVTGVEEVMSTRLKDIIVKVCPYYNWDAQQSSETENPTGVTVENISAAANLPSGNLVRRVLAETAVRDFFQGNMVDFWKETCQAIPSFGLDLLEATRDTMATVRHDRYNMRFVDPINRSATEFPKHQCPGASCGSWGCDCMERNNVSTGTWGAGPE